MMSSHHDSYRSTKKPRFSVNDFALNSSYSSSVSEWSSLPKDVFFLILHKLFEAIDHIRLAAVCKHWHDVSKEHNHTTQRWCKVLPMLMIPISSSQTERMVGSIPEGKIYTNVQLPVPYEKRCSGSSHGWLATARENFTITLLSPFRKAEAIHLPPLKALHDLSTNLQKRRNKLKKKQYPYYVRKVILSADPSLNPDTYVVVAIFNYCTRLAFIRAGQRDWTYIEEPQYIFSDAIFHRGEVYAVGLGGVIVSVDISKCNDPTQQPKANRLTPFTPMVHPVFPDKADRAYLVESSNGELLHVRRFSKPKEGIDQKLGVVNFVVYKVLFSDKDGSIVKQDVVDSIGDDALFLGDNHSMSVLASNFPRCQPNSIYFTNDMRNGDMGIFSLDDKTFRQLFPLIDSSPPAIWIVPPISGLC